MKRPADATAIRIREIVTRDHLGLDFGGVDFWTDRPVSELIAEADAGRGLLPQVDAGS